MDDKALREEAIAAHQALAARGESALRPGARHFVPDPFGAAQDWRGIETEANQEIRRSLENEELVRKDRFLDRMTSCHGLLNDDIERLTAASVWVSTTTPQAWLAGCTAAFRHFHTQLRRHIDMEEGGGFLEPVRARRPDLVREVETLRQEHRDLLACCTHIEQACEAITEPTADQIRGMQGDIDALLTRLQHHERVENRLVQEVFNRDIGVGD